MNEINVRKLHNLILHKINNSFDCPWLYKELLEYILEGYRLKVNDANSYGIKKLIERDDVIRIDSEIRHIAELEKFLEE
jgi:hypothetical protein